jgi:hypothetical protein
MQLPKDQAVSGKLHSCIILMAFFKTFKWLCESHFHADGTTFMRTILVMAVGRFEICESNHWIRLLATAQQPITYDARIYSLRRAMLPFVGVLSCVNLLFTNTRAVGQIDETYCHCFFPLLILKGSFQPFCDDFHNVRGFDKLPIQFTFL